MAIKGQVCLVSFILLFFQCQAIPVSKDKNAKTLQAQKALETSGAQGLVTGELSEISQEKRQPQKQYGLWGRSAEPPQFGLWGKRQDGLGLWGKREQDAMEDGSHVVDKRGKGLGLWGRSAGGTMGLWGKRSSQGNGFGLWGKRQDGLGLWGRSAGNSFGLWGRTTGDKRQQKIGLWGRSAEPQNSVGLWGRTSKSSQE